MEARFTNGCSVNRVWSDCKNTELVAAFQYERDAELYAEAKLADDAEHKLSVWAYIITDTYSGKIAIMRARPVET